MKKNKLFIFLLLFISVSCIKEIDFEEGIIEPQMVSNCIITPGGSGNKLTITTSQPKTKVNNRFEFLENAIVRFYENSIENENIELTYLNNKPVYYDIGPDINIGNTYKIEIDHPKYGYTVAETSIPNPISINSIDTLSELIDYGYGYTDRRSLFKVEFTDPENEHNYYRIKVMTINGYHRYGNLGNDTIWISTNWDSYIYSDDRLLNPDDADEFFSNSAPNEFNIFSDELINGKTYGLKFSSNRQWEYADFDTNEFVQYYIILQSLSEDMYLYLKSVTAHHWFDEEPLMEPVQVYSNFENSIGVFAGYSADTAVFQIGEYPIEGVTYEYDYY